MSLFRNLTWRTRSRESTNSLDPSFVTPSVVQPLDAGTYRLPTRLKDVQKQIHHYPPTRLPPLDASVYEIRYFLFQVLTVESYRVAKHWPQWVVETCARWQGTGAELRAMSVDDWKRFCPLNSHFAGFDYYEALQESPVPECRERIGEAMSRKITTLKQQEEMAENLKRDWKETQRGLRSRQGAAADAGRSTSFGQGLQQHYGMEHDGSARMTSVNAARSCLHSNTWDEKQTFDKWFPPGAHPQPEPLLSQAPMYSGQKNFSSPQSSGYGSFSSAQTDTVSTAPTSASTSNEAIAALQRKNRATYVQSIQQARSSTNSRASCVQQQYDPYPKASNSQQIGGGDNLARPLPFAPPQNPPTPHPSMHHGSPRPIEPTQQTPLAHQNLAQSQPLSIPQHSHSMPRPSRSYGTLSKSQSRTNHTANVNQFPQHNTQATAPIIRETLPAPPPGFEAQYSQYSPSIYSQELHDLCNENRDRLMSLPTRSSHESLHTSNGMRRKNPLSNMNRHYRVNEHSVNYPHPDIMGPRSGSPAHSLVSASSKPASVANSILERFPIPVGAANPPPPSLPPPAAAAATATAASECRSTRSISNVLPSPTRGTTPVPAVRSFSYPARPLKYVNSDVETLQRGEYVALKARESHEREEAIRKQLDRMYSQQNTGEVDGLVGPSTRMLRPGGGQYKTLVEQIREREILDGRLKRR